MSDKRRWGTRWVVGLWIAGAIIVAAYYALWRAGAGAMETAVADWVNDQRAAGLVVEHGAVERDGFPFFLRVHIDAPHIEQPGVFSWNAERLSLDALPYDLNRLIFSPSGQQRFSADRLGEWRYSADDIRASVANDKTRGWVFSMNIENAVAAGADGAEARLASLIYDLAPAADAPTTLTLNSVGAGFSFRDGQREIAVDTMESSISVSETQFITGYDAASNWRNAGGAVQIHGLNAAVDDARLSVSGVISLDDENRPRGALTTTLEKPAGLAALLAASGALDAEEADAAMAGLALAAMAQGGRIEAPIELHAGAATIAGFKIADLPAAP